MPPAPLQAQALCDITLEQVLAEVSEPALPVDEHLAAHVTPAPAKGEILGAGLLAPRSVGT